MPWQVRIDLEPDQTPQGNDIGIITASFSDDADFSTPFIVRERLEIIAANLQPFKLLCNQKLNVEVQRRSRAANRAQVVENALNS